MPTASGAGHLRDLLLRLGCEEVHPRSPDARHSYYVRRGPDHWVDFMLGHYAGEPHDSLFIRIALCNPEGVLPVLRRVFATLLAGGGGYIQDMNRNVLDTLGMGGRRYTALSEAEWEAVEAAFKARRAEYRKYFGTFEAPISEDDLAAYRRKPPDSGGSHPA